MDWSHITRIINDDIPLLYQNLIKVECHAQTLVSISYSFISDRRFRCSRLKMPSNLAFFMKNQNENNRYWVIVCSVNSKLYPPPPQQMTFGGYIGITLSVSFARAPGHVPRRPALKPRVTKYFPLLLWLDLRFNL